MYVVKRESSIIDLQIWDKVYIIVLHKRIISAFQRKQRINYPALAKSRTAWSAARLPLLGWRCALVRILVFSFHLLSSSRRWLRWIDLGFLSEGLSVQAESLCCISFIVVFLFFLSKWGLRKILSLSTEWLKESLTQIKLFLKKTLTQLKLFLKERITPR